MSKMSLYADDMLLYVSKLTSHPQIVFSTLSGYKVVVQWFCYKLKHLNQKFQRICSLALVLIVKMCVFSLFYTNIMKHFNFHKHWLINLVLIVYIYPKICRVFFMNKYITTLAKTLKSSQCKVKTLMMIMCLVWMERATDHQLSSCMLSTNRSESFLSHHTINSV